MIASWVCSISDFLRHMLIPLHMLAHLYSIHTSRRKGFWNVTIVIKSSESAYEIPHRRRLFSTYSTFYIDLSYHLISEHTLSRNHISEPKVAKRLYLLVTYIYSNQDRTSRTHKGERLMECHQCEKAFGRNFNIWDHIIYAYRRIIHGQNGK